MSYQSQRLFSTISHASLDDSIHSFANSSTDYKYYFGQQQQQAAAAGGGGRGCSSSSSAIGIVIVIFLLQAAVPFRSFRLVLSGLVFQSNHTLFLVVVDGDVAPTRARENSLLVKTAYRLAPLPLRMPTIVLRRQCAGTSLWSSYGRPLELLSLRRPRSLFVEQYKCNLEIRSFSNEDHFTVVTPIGFDSI